MTAPVVVGVDGAESSGVVVVHGGRIIRRGICVVTSWADVERCVDGVAAFSPDLVVIEDCFVRGNAATGLILARLTGRWLQTFERRRIETTLVLASTWQPVILRGRISARTRRAERKAAAVAWGLETFGIVLPEDQADAAAIGAWGVLEYAARTAGSSWQSRAALGGELP